MISYKLDCKNGHTFDGWFASSAAFDRQAKRGLVACPMCGATKVKKALMAPRVTTSKQKSRARSEAAVSAPSSGTDVSATRAHGGAVTREQRRLLELMRRVRQEVEANSEYVGPKFADEARKIHYEEAPARSIYGEASRAEVEQLHEEGVAAYPLPDLPEDKN